MGYDALGRGRYSIDAVRSVVKRDYDSDGQLRSLTDAIGNVSEYQYDNRGKILKEIDPFGNEVTYEYDNKGRMTKRTDRLGRVREFSYDDDDLLTSGVWKTSGTPVNTITYSRDDNHNLLTAGDNAGTYTMMYDALFGSPRGKSKGLLKPSITLPARSAGVGDHRLAWRALWHTYQD